MEFKEYTHDEILLARTNSGLMTEIIESFKYAIEKYVNKCKSYTRISLEDDLINIGRFAVYYAVMNFDTSCGVQFKTYCFTQIKGRIYNEVRCGSVAQKEEKNTVSLNKKQDVYSEYELETLIESYYKDSDILFDELELKLMLWNDLKNILTPKQFIVMQLFYQDYNKREIAEKLGVTRADVEQKVKAAHLKLSKTLDRNKYSGWL